MLRYYLIVLMALSGCSHQNSAKISFKAEPPTWAFENCAPTEEGFLFTGYGVSTDMGEASRRTLIDAKKNALLCIIGGQFSYYFSSIDSYSSENNSKQAVEESLRVSLNIDDVDWTGFTKILGKHWVNQRPEAGVELYSQYRWPNDKIKASRAHLDLLVAEIEKNRVLEKQVTRKNQLIEAQASQMALLQKKAAKLEQLKITSQQKANELKNREQELKSLQGKLPALERKAQGYEDMASKVNDLLDVVRQKNAAIAEQRELLREVNAKKREYEALKNATKRAVAELKRLKRIQQNETNRLRPIMDAIYCGTTISDVQKLLGPKDACEQTMGRRDSWCYESRWGEFVLTASKNEGYRISYVRDKYGNGGLRKVCK
jgi:hypothetical protein